MHVYAQRAGDAQAAAGPSLPPHRRQIADAAAGAVEGS